MESVFKWLSGRKTYISALATILVSGASLVGATIPGIPAVDRSAAVEMLTTAIMAIFLRQGIAKAGPTA